MKKSTLWGALGALCGILGFVFSFVQGKEEEKEFQGQLEEVDKAITASFERNKEELKQELESI